MAQFGEARYAMLRHYCGLWRGGEVRLGYVMLARLEFEAFRSPSPLRALGPVSLLFEKVYLALAYRSSPRKLVPIRMCRTGSTLHRWGEETCKPYLDSIRVWLISSQLRLISSRPLPT